MRRTSILWDGLGQPFALFALLCQMVSVVLAVPDMVAARLVSDVSVICHTEPGPVPAHDRAPSHHPAECPLCPLCQAVSLTAIAPAPPVVPGPVQQRALVLLPPVRAGPVVAAVRVAAQPRGPPARV